MLSRDSHELLAIYKLLANHLKCPGAAEAARPAETAIFLPDRLQARRDRLIKVQPPQGIAFASSGTETLLDREGVRAILDTARPHVSLDTGRSRCGR